MPEKQRLSKIMASRGMCSRREADRYIERGWVLVDGRPVSELGTRIDPGRRIELSPEARHERESLATFLLNKPVGFVSGQPEKGYKAAASLIVPANRWRGDRSGIRFSPTHRRGLAPAGRLDIDSHGLLVLTQDGCVARAVIGENSSVEKEYLVRVEGRLEDGGLALLRHGLELDGKPLKPAEVSRAERGRLRFVLREGKKRQIRRMCELVGLKVVGLRRVRIGNVRLGELPRGAWRYLLRDERF